MSAIRAIRAMRANGATTREIRAMLADEYEVYGSNAVALIAQAEGGELL